MTLGGTTQMRSVSRPTSTRPRRRLRRGPWGAAPPPTRDRPARAGCRPVGGGGRGRAEGVRPPTELHTGTGGGGEGVGGGGSGPARGQGEEGAAVRWGGGGPHGRRRGRRRGRVEVGRVGAEHADEVVGVLI